MSTKLIVARAITAYAALRSLKLVTTIAVSALAVSIAIVVILALQFSAWWLVLLTPLLLIGFTYLVVWLLLRRVITTIYRHPFSREQRTALATFRDKVVHLLEAKATPLPVFALITLKDVVRNRDATTLRDLINNSTSLKEDFQNLERLFEVK